jgi:hypothetical protein
MVSSNPVAFFFNTCQQRSNLFDWFLLEFIMIHEQCRTFQKGMKSLDWIRQKPLNPGQKMYLICLFHLRLGHLHTHTGFCAEISVCPYSPWLLFETGQTFIACVLIPLLKVWTFGLLSDPYHTALYGDWLHCNPVQGRTGNKQVYPCNEKRIPAMITG